MSATSFPRDYVFLLTRGVFCHRHYAEHYLGSKYWAPFALAHYLARGERRGRRPNPFFDPAYRRGYRFVDYLRGDGMSAPSVAFDPVFYVARNPDWRAAFPHPFLHFWRRGFAANSDPSPVISLRLINEAHRGNRKKALRLLYRALTKRGSPYNLPLALSPAELDRRREQFLNGIELRTLKRTTPRHRFLVFVQLSSGTDIARWQGERNFDLLFNYYDDTREPPALADHAFAQRGTKVTAIAKMLAEAPDLLSAYDSVLFLDDDVALDRAGIDRLFAIVAERGLDLAQASLTATSQGWPFVKQPGVGAAVRRVAAVEIMMPVVSRRALLKAGWAFREGITGWGVDLLLSHLVTREFGDTIAVVGEVVAAHERRVDTKGGALYRFLDRHGIEPGLEFAALIDKFGLDRTLAATGAPE